MVTKIKKVHTVKRLGRAAATSALGIILLSGSIGGFASKEIPSFSKAGFESIGRETLTGFNMISEYAYKSVFENKEDTQLWKQYKFAGIKLREDNISEEIRIRNVYKNYVGLQVRNRYEDKVRKDDKNYKSAEAQLRKDYKIRKANIDSNKNLLETHYEKKLLVERLGKDIRAGEESLYAIHRAIGVRLMKHYQAKEELIINSTETESKIQLQKGYEISSPRAKRMFIRELRNRYLHWTDKLRKGYGIAAAKLDKRANIRETTLKSDKTNLRKEYNGYKTAIENGYKKEKAKFTKKYKPIKPTLTGKIQGIVLIGFGGFVLALGIAFSFEAIRILLHPFNGARDILWAFGLKDDRHHWFKPKQKEKEDDTKDYKNAVSNNKFEKIVKFTKKYSTRTVFFTSLFIVTFPFSIPLVLPIIIYRKMKHPTQPTISDMESNPEVSKEQQRIPNTHNQEKRRIEETKANKIGHEEDRMWEVYEQQRKNSNQY